MSETAVLIEARNICKRYRGRNRSIEALSDVNLTLNRGETLGIVGESGSGKSTLLSVLCGLEKPDSGRILIAGEDVTGAGPAVFGKKLQMIFQDARGSFDPRQTFLSSIHEVNPARDPKDLQGILLKTGLTEELLQRHPGELSVGQCQRMSIARALYSGAEILLCDEITSALDVSTQTRVIRLLKELKKAEELSFVFVTHDIVIARAFCDRIMVFRSGCCVEEGPAGRIFEKPEHEYTRCLIENAEIG